MPSQEWADEDGSHKTSISTELSTDYFEFVSLIPPSDGLTILYNPLRENPKKWLLTNRLRQRKKQFDRPAGQFSIWPFGNSEMTLQPLAFSDFRDNFD